MNKMKFGWSEKDITPPKKVSLAGQFAERISEYVEKPICATALCISDGVDEAIFVSLDLVGAPANLIDEVRKRLSGNSLGIDPDKIILSAIHTHTAPVFPRRQRTATPFLSSSPKELIKAYLPAGRKYVEKENTQSNPEIMSEEDTFELIVEQILAAIIEAKEGLEEGSFANGFGRAAVGMCRRAAYSDGTAQMWGNTQTAYFTELEGGNDSGIELMFIYGKDGALSGIIANLACPAQCVQHRLFVSPDFWGEVKVLLRRRFGEKIFLLPQCSAAGDQCPVDLVRWVEPESPVNDPNIERELVAKRKADPSMFDISGMKRVGKRIANEIIDVYENYLTAPISEAEFIHKHEILKLPIRRVTMSEVREAELAIREYLNAKNSDVDYNDAAKLQVHLGTVKRSKTQEIQNTLDTEIHVIKLGNTVFATNPFELFLDYGNRIKARSLAEQTFIVQLANGGEGYLPTEKAERGGHYSAFVSSGQVGHEGGEMLVCETLDRIVELF